MAIANDMDLIMPLLNTIRNVCPDFELRYWDSDIKIKDKTISYYVSFSTNRNYTANVLDGTITLDIWSRDNSFATATYNIYNALERYGENLTIDDTSTAEIIIDRIRWTDFGREDATRMYRRNIQIDFRVLFVPIIIPPPPPPLFNLAAGTIN